MAVALRRRYASQRGDNRELPLISRLFYFLLFFKYGHDTVRYLLVTKKYLKRGHLFVSLRRSFLCHLKILEQFGVVWGCSGLFGVVRGYLFASFLRCILLKTSYFCEIEVLLDSGRQDLFKKALKL